MKQKMKTVLPGLMTLLLGVVLSFFMFATTAKAEVREVASASDIQNAINACAASGDTIKMTGDITLPNGSAAVGFIISKDIIFDLNGHILNLNGKGRAFFVGTNGKLTLKDSNSENTHYLKKESGTWRLGTDTTVTFDELTAYPDGDCIVAVSGGVIMNGTATDNATLTVAGYGTFNELNNLGGAIRNHGTLIMEGGSIIGCHAGYAGAIFNAEETTRSNFVMKGGLIAACSGIAQGGGLIVRNDGTISGGTITCCKVTGDSGDGLGGGVFVSGYGVISITGGEIKYNKSVGGAAKRGGGVCGYGKVSVSGDAKITNNSSVGSGGGIFVESGLTVGGSAVVSGNTVGSTANNVYLTSGKTIEISKTEPLTDSAKIGVTTASAPTDGEAVSFTTSGNATSFTSDSGNYIDNNGRVVTKGFIIAEAKDDATKPKFYASLTLNDNIDINLSIKGHDGTSAPNLNKNDIIITVNGTQIAKEDITQETAITCTLKAVSPIKMTENITVKIYYIGTTDSDLIKSFTYSVRTYCDTVFANKANTDNLYKLCEAVLNYGKLAEDYYNSIHNPGAAESTTNSGCSDSYKSADLSKVPDPISTSCTYVTEATAELALDSNISLIIKIKTSETTLPNISIINEKGEKVSEKNISIETISGGYSITISKINSSKLSHYYTLTVDGWTGFGITYGVYNYCKKVVTAGSGTYTDTLIALCKAIYTYGEAAAAYKPVA